MCFREILHVMCVFVAVVVVAVWLVGLSESSAGNVNMCNVTG